MAENKTYEYEVVRVPPNVACQVADVWPADLGKTLAEKARGGFRVAHLVAADSIGVIAIIERTSP